MDSPSTLIRLPDVLAIVALGRSAWLDLVKERKAPQPIKIGRATMWDKNEIQGWIGARIKAHRARSPVPAASEPLSASEPTARRFTGSRDKHRCIDDEVVSISFAIGSIDSSLMAIRELLEQAVAKLHNVK